MALPDGQRLRTFARVCLVRLAAALVMANVALPARAQSAGFFVPPGANGPLIQGTDGNFYGTSYADGVANLGTIYQATPGGTVTVLHSFAGATDGAKPLSGLTQAADGSFYGTTSEGGALAQGTIFRMSPDGVFVVLHEFNGSDGSAPQTVLIQASDGNFYGLTQRGGSSDLGTIFQMAPDGTLTTLHSFAGGVDGELPSALIQATDGALYGTTVGIVNGSGTIFRIAVGTYTVLHAFSESESFYNPRGFIQADDGNFYGAAQSNGLNVVFRMTVDGTLSVLSTDPVGPLVSLIEATDGNLYATTADVPACAPPVSICPTFDATLSRIEADGTVTVVSDLGATTPSGAPLQAADGSFYMVFPLVGAFGSVARVTTILCRDSLNLAYSAGTLNIGFNLMTSSSPVVWSTWLVLPNVAFTLWSVPIPPISPVVSFNVPLAGFPSLGTVGIVSTLTSPGFGTVFCGDFKTVATTP